MDISISDFEQDYNLIFQEAAEKQMTNTIKERENNNQWRINGKGSFSPSTRTVEVIPSGLYEVLALPSGLQFNEKTIHTDDLLKFPNSLSDRIVNEITHFWGRRKEFNEIGILHRRGYIMHGKPGSGKTCIIQLILKRMFALNGVAFLCTHPHTLTAGLQALRTIEPDRPIVCIFEDIDALINSFGEDVMLSLLDGENQIDHVVNIATTNYIENLDKRITERPRRFDRLIKIDMPEAIVRRAYLKIKFKLGGDDLEKYVEATDGFTFAALADLVVTVKCLEKSFEEAISAIRALLQLGGL